MLNTYIKNRGITKTIIHNNGDNHIKQINWDADYDGDRANISVNTDSDGNRDHFDISLSNEDLANILNVESINMPLHKRLEYDFREPSYIKEPYYIELPAPEIEARKPRTVEELLSKHISSPYISSPYISSPLSNEELIVPLTIDQKSADKYTLTPERRHRRLKTHASHKAYKKHKSHTKSKSKSRRNSKSSRKTSSLIDLL